MFCSIFIVEFQLVFGLESGELIGVLARVLGVVVPRTCGGGIWVHLGLNLMFGSFWFGLEMVESKEEISLWIFKLCLRNQAKEPSWDKLGLCSTIEEGVLLRLR